MRNYFFCLLSTLLLASSFHAVNSHEVDFEKLTKENEKPIVIATKKLFFPDYPTAHNPSIVKSEDGFWLTFRYLPNAWHAWISYIYIVRLDEDFSPLSEPQLLDTRCFNKNDIPSQSEDARIVAINGIFYVIYNDNEEIINPQCTQRRDMFVAQVSYSDGKFTLSKPLRMYHPAFYYVDHWQKNWSPFEYQNTLLLSYTLKPHEVIFPNLETGVCSQLALTDSNIQWKYGDLRGGTPALLVDGEYLAFYHSQIHCHSSVSKDRDRHHYYMGAYTFASEPPFEITRYTPTPIIGKHFYTESDADKRVVFPGGFLVLDPYIYVVYGKDDREMHVSILDKKELYHFFKPVNGILH